MSGAACISPGRSAPFRPTAVCFASRISLGRSAHSRKKQQLCRGRKVVIYAARDRYDRGDIGSALPELFKRAVVS